MAKLFSKILQLIDSQRVVKDLYPGIAAGQVASLRAAGVIDESQEKKVLKEFIAG